MVYPVPRVDVPAFFRQGIVTRQVPVAENEIIERLLPQHFAAVSDDGFLLAPENLVRLLMGAAAWFVRGFLEGRGLSNGLVVIASIAAAGVLSLILVLAFRIITREDCALLPKGDKIARVLHIS